MFPIAPAPMVMTFRTGDAYSVSAPCRELLVRQQACSGQFITILAL